MKPRLLARREGGEVAAGLVLAQDVRGKDGKIALDKGRVLSGEDAASLGALPWAELHLIELEPGDLHEDPAGRRLANAAAGANVEVRPLAGGAWPLLASCRGLFEVDAARLARLNELGDLVLYTLPHQQCVVAGELLGRAKVVPFATTEARVGAAEAIAAEARDPQGGSGLLRVRPFVKLRVAALVQEALDEQKLSRFRRAFEEKLAFFGSELVSVEVIASSAAELAKALSRAVEGGAQLVAIAGSKPMDPLDPALIALARSGARLEVHGVPAHPGTLLWLASLGTATIVGMPSCGLFSKATVFDLLLPRLLAGERLSRAEVAALGCGGLLSRDMAYRFPSYRPARSRGELDP